MTYSYMMKPAFIFLTRNRMNCDSVSRMLFYNGTLLNHSESFATYALHSTTQIRYFSEKKYPTLFSVNPT